MEATKQAAAIAALTPGQAGLVEAEYECRHWIAKIPAGTPMQALEAPEFWSHHAAQLKPWDEISARAHDGTWYAKLLVLDTSRTWAKVKILTHYALTTKDVSQSQAANAELEAAIAKYKLVHRGVHKWSVVRISDSQVMHQGEETKDGAGKAMVELAVKDLTGGIAQPA